jgi:histidine triad (HIT) family protein
MSCLFCDIANGKKPAKIIWQNESLVAFRDINPQAPVHVLVIPRKHIDTLNELADGDSELMGRMIVAAKEIARQEGVAVDGYRLVLNCNRGAGQSVFHIHLHLLGGRGLAWPPG